MEDLIWAFSPFLSRLLVFDLVEAAMPFVGVKLGFIPLFSATFAVKNRKYLEQNLPILKVEEFMNHTSNCS